MRTPLLLALLAWSVPAAASTIYVAASASPGGTGTSWGTAHNDLQTALAAAQSGDEIRVAPGTYKPGPAGSARSTTFSIPSGVAVRGGFAGPSAANPDERNITAFLTVLSGDFNGNDGPNFSGYSENAFHVVTISSGNSATVLDGFTVRSGSTSGGSVTQGAGVLVSSGTPAIVDCVLTANDGPNNGGGGMGIVNSFGTVTRCSFIANRSQMRGAGLLVSGSGTHVTDCLFEGNMGGMGAGAFNTGGSDATYLRCTFRANTGQISSNSGTGLYDNQSTSWVVSCSFIRNTNGSGGGAIFSASSFTQVRGSIFIGNRADFDGGGAVYVIGPNGHAIFTNCYFTGSLTQASGTACFSGTGALLDLINCTIVNSGQGAGAGALSSNPGTTRLHNSILWNNRDSSGLGQSSQFFGVAPVVDHCFVQGWTGSLGGAGNSGALPRFVNLLGPDNIPGNDDDNARLLPGSPCIDGSVNAWIGGNANTDADGNPRFLDDPGTPDTGTGTAPIADIGCYEFQGTTCYANCDNSTVAPILNVNDFSCFLNRFAAGDSAANCDGSTAAPVLNVNDFSCFLNSFAAGCP